LVVAAQPVGQLYITALAANHSPPVGAVLQRYRLKTIGPCKKVMGMAAAPCITG